MDLNTVENSHTHIHSQTQTHSRHLSFITPYQHLRRLNKSHTHTLIHTHSSTHTFIHTHSPTSTLTKVLLSNPSLTKYIFKKSQSNLFKSGEVGVDFLFFIVIEGYRVL